MSPCAYLDETAYRRSEGRHRPLRSDAKRQKIMRLSPGPRPGLSTRNGNSHRGLLQSRRISDFPRNQNNAIVDRPGKARLEGSEGVCILKDARLSQADDQNGPWPPWRTGKILPGGCLRARREITTAISSSKWPWSIPWLASQPPRD